MLLSYTKIHPHVSAVFVTIIKVPYKNTNKLQHWAIVIFYQYFCNTRKSGRNMKVNLNI